MTERASLLKEIDEASFAMNDATLYLDTHPTDEAALQYFQMCQFRRKKAMQAFEENYEPLTVDCVNYENNNKTDSHTCYANQKHWTWGDGPMPWEGVYD